MKMDKRGISLIVLIITIIIMIIIAGAIILSLNGSGVISNANKAKNDSDISSKKEAATVALTEYDLLVYRRDSSVQNKTAAQYVREKLEAQRMDASNVTVVNGEVLVGSGASAINKEVAIGDLVAYKPTAKTSTKYKVGQTDTYFATQTGLSWQYMGLDDKGNALLVSKNATNSKLYLYGKEGFAEGPNKLNDLCKELYSSALGEARSINVDDVNKLLGANPVGKYRSKTGDELNNTDNLTIGQLISQKGEGAINYTQTPEEGRNINSYVVDFYSYSGATYKETTTNEYKTIFTGIPYWLASTAVYPWFGGPQCVVFYVRYVSPNGVSGRDIYNSRLGEYGAEYVVRPVVVLKSNVKFGNKNGSVWSIS